MIFRSVLRGNEQSVKVFAMILRNDVGTYPLRMARNPIFGVRCWGVNHRSAASKRWQKCCDRDGCARDHSLLCPFTCLVPSMFRISVIFGARVHIIVNFVSFVERKSGPLYRRFIQNLGAADCSGTVGLLRRGRSHGHVISSVDKFAHRKKKAFPS